MSEPGDNHVVYQVQPPLPAFTCPRCQREMLVHNMAGDVFGMCKSCCLAWRASPEHTRLGFITRSLVSEWIERERCEENAAKQNAAFGVEVVAVPPAVPQQKESTENDGRDVASGSEGGSKGSGAGSP